MNKLLLFDIDGTLITGHGTPKKVALEVIRKYFPTFKNGNEVPFNGMTDPLIVQSILAANDHTIKIDDPIINTILDDFISELQKYVNPQNPPTLLPGIKNLLDLLKERKDLYTGLVTGNVISGAKIKLNASGIYNYFEIGAYGSDHWDRNKLPPIAIKRAVKKFAVNFDHNNVWIIGDSPKDVECAKVNHLKCLAVETGKVSSTLLSDLGADKVLSDLSDSNYILDYICNH